MSTAARVRARLAAVAPASSGRLDGDGFLLLGAGVGLVGWGATAVVEALPVPRAGLVALAVWTPLVAVVVGASLLYAPDAVRFSLPMLGWGPLNATATAVTVAAVGLGVPATVGGGPFGPVALGPAAGVVWSIWALDLAAGYAWTADALRRDRQPGRAAGYSYAAVLGLGLLAAHGADVEAVRAVRYPALALLHALPLALDAWTDPGGGRRAVVLALAVLALVGVGALP